MTMRTWPLCSPNIASRYSAALVGLKLKNQFRASRITGSRRRSYNFRIRFASSCLLIFVLLRLKDSSPEVEQGLFDRLDLVWFDEITVQRASANLAVVAQLSTKVQTLRRRPELRAPLRAPAQSPRQWFRPDSSSLGCALLQAPQANPF